MKVMIAYDGSHGSDAAVEDLQFAGLPAEGQLLVVSVADVYATSIPLQEEIRSLRKLVSDRVVGETVDYAHKETCKVRGQAVETASMASDRIRTFLPRWSVWREAAVGDPESELLRRAEDWKPDLVLVGSNKRGTIERFFLTSISKAVAEKAACSVRIVTDQPTNTGGSPRLIAAADNMPDVGKLVGAIGRRRWPPGTAMDLLVVDDRHGPDQISAVYPHAKRIFDQAVQPLTDAGLYVSVDFRSGLLKSALDDEVRDHCANTFFVAGPNAGSPLSEVAESLVTGAECTVEIVRELRPT